MQFSKYNARFGALALAALMAGSLGFAATDAIAGPFPTQSKIKAGPGRFQPVLAGQAYLDKETGLVWEAAPSSTQQQWAEANFHCYGRVVGGRMGWRLPAIEEILSLFEPDGDAGAKRLALGHPFTNLTSDGFWSNTRVALVESDLLYVVGRQDGGINFDSPLSAVNDLQAWCVRAGRGHNPSDFEAP